MKKKINLQALAEVELIIAQKDQCNRILLCFSAMKNANNTLLYRIHLLVKYSAIYFSFNTCKIA